MSSRPSIIGITPSFIPSETGEGQLRLGEYYWQAIQDEGALPVILPPGPDGSGVETACAMVDGLLFSGGGDLDPSLYGAAPHPETAPIPPARQLWDLALIRAAHRKGIPVLAICLGMQEINVAFGGTLHQHVPDVTASPHRPSDRARPVTHDVALVPGSTAARVLGALSATVNSYHHQAVERVATGFLASGRSEDGIIEAIEPEGPDPGFFLGVQWHPERMLSDSTQRRMFNAFADACRDSRGV